MYKINIATAILLSIIFTSCFKVNEVSEESCNEPVIEFANSMKVKPDTQDFIPLDVRQSSNTHYRQKYLYITADSVEGHHQFSCYMLRPAKQNFHQIKVLIKYHLPRSTIQIWNGGRPLIKNNTFWQLKAQKKSAELLKKNIQSITITAFYHGDDKSTEYTATISNLGNLQNIFHTEDVSCGTKLLLNIGSITIEDELKNKAVLENISMKAIVN